MILAPISIGELVDKITILEIKQSKTSDHVKLENINKEVFDTKFIVDLDLRTSGIQINKKSFMNLEITFFTTEHNLDFKSKKLKDSLKKLSKIILDENFSSDEYFKLHLRKTNKKEELA